MRTYWSSSLIVLGIFFALELSGTPYMASLKAKRAYVRTGPGKYYPVQWILLLPTTPLRITESFDVWHKIEDPLGGIGWIHKSLIWKKKYLYLIKDTLLRHKPTYVATPQAKIKKGTIVFLKDTSKDWFYVQTGPFKGYVPRTLCWQNHLYTK